MLDDLPYERNTGKRRGHRRRRKSRTGLTLTLVLVLLATLGVGGYFGYDKVKSFFVAPDYAGDGNGTKVQVEIADGSNLTDMGNALYKKDIVKSAKAFVNAAEAEPKSSGIGPGTYAMEEQMSGDAAVDRMLDPKARKVSGVTIREGLTQWGTFKKLSEFTGVPVEDFEAAAEDPEALGVDPSWFERKDGSKTAESIEGFLFPSTYDFKKNGTAEDMLAEMVAQFMQVAESIGFKDTVAANRSNYSPYEALIVASLAEAEAGVPKDLGKVARVAYNRMDGEYWCNGGLENCLEFDSTTNYGLMAAGEGSKNSKDLTDAELYDEDNKWSTHVRDGLPPTPINSPGKAAMEGAADPPPGKWVFFVAIDKEGNSAFAETSEEHEENKQTAKENGVL